MDESQKPEFAITLSAMFESFGQEATKPRLLGYWLGLQDLPLERVQHAVARGIRELRHLPMPAELRGLAGVLGAVDQATLAWGDVLKAVPLGPYKHIDFEDGGCNACIRLLGGWPTFLERFSDAESEKWARIDFMKTYQSLVSSGVDGELTAPLAGLAQVAVVDRQLGPPVPVRIECARPRQAIEQRSERCSIVESVPSIAFRRVE
jgi:hypothetical protein